MRLFWRQKSTTLLSESSSKVMESQHVACSGEDDPLDGLSLEALDGGSVADDISTMIQDCSKQQESSNDLKTSSDAVRSDEHAVVGGGAGVVRSFCRRTMRWLPPPRTTENSAVKKKRDVPPITSYTRSVLDRERQEEQLIVALVHHELNRDKPAPSNNKRTRSKTTSRKRKKKSKKTQPADNDDDSRSKLLYRKSMHLPVIQEEEDETATKASSVLFDGCWTDETSTSSDDEEDVYLDEAKDTDNNNKGGQALATADESCDKEQHSIRDFVQGSDSRGGEDDSRDDDTLFDLDSQGAAGSVSFREEQRMDDPGAKEDATLQAQPPAFQTAPPVCSWGDISLDGEGGGSFLVKDADDSSVAQLLATPPAATRPNSCFFGGGRHHTVRRRLRERPRSVYFSSSEDNKQRPREASVTYELLWG